MWGSSARPLRKPSPCGWVRVSRSCGSSTTIQVEGGWPIEVGTYCYPEAPVIVTSESSTNL
ncbi:hypothetical protein Ae717Ps2_6364 [Pseudonocardia sp. Ae717_Ps2]|nr:hypothetical protein Ae717Ps2_6364 [Pseudonocardia sp. Ae717_Ps2]